MSSSESSSLAITIIVPLCSREQQTLLHLSNMGAEIARTEDIELIIVDNSPGERAACLSVDLKNYTYVHCSWGTLNANRKTLNVLTGLDRARGRAIILMDDDTRPTVDQLRDIAAQLPLGGMLRPMVKVLPRSIINDIDQVAVLLVNVLSKDRQFWAMMAISSLCIAVAKSMPVDTIFDELTMHRTLVKSGATWVYASGVAVISTPQRSLPKFFEQRFRYTYENLAYPIRSVTLAAIMPILLLIAETAGALSTIVIVFLIGCASVVAAGLGWAEFGRRHSIPFVVCFGAPIWVLYNATFIWPAIVLRFTVGLQFAGGQLKRPG